MRYSIIILFIGITSELLAFQPPVKEQISPAEFAQEALREKSYIKLLPRDVTLLVKQYLYNSLPKTIRALRAEYLNDPEKKELLLSDSNFNKQLIESLHERFKETSPLVIALMINTPASGNYVPAIMHEMRLLRESFIEYLKQNLGYQEAIEYAREYYRLNQPAMNRARFGWGSLFDQSEIAYLLAQKYHQELSLKPIAAHIQIIIDLRVEPFEWISRMISFDPEYNPPNENDITQLRFYTPQNQGFSSRNYDSKVISAIMLQVCEAIFILLTRAFQSNNFNDIDVLLDSIFGGRFLNQDFQKCFFEKLDTKLISQIVQYMGNNRRSARFYPTTLAVLLWDYALKNENAQTILHVLNYFILDHMVHEEPYYPGSPILRRQIKVRNQFLMDSIKSPNTDVAIVRHLIRKYANYNQVDENGITLLMHAIRDARFDIAHLLLDQLNININACDSNGHNALSFAGLLPESTERDALIKRLKDMGAQDEGVCVIQ